MMMMFIYFLFLKYTYSFCLLCGFVLEIFPGGKRGGGCTALVRGETVKCISFSTKQRFRMNGLVAK